MAKKQNYLPDHVMIMGQRWAVKLVECIKNDPGILGLCDSENREILLRESLAPDCAVDTLFHEIYHAYSFTTPLRVHDKHHEYLVQYFAAATVDILRGNKPWWQKP